MRQGAQSCLTPRTLADCRRRGPRRGPVPRSRGEQCAGARPRGRRRPRRRSSAQARELAGRERPAVDEVHERPRRDQRPDTRPPRACRSPATRDRPDEDRREHHEILGVGMRRAEQRTALPRRSEPGRIGPGGGGPGRRAARQSRRPRPSRPSPITSLVVPLPAIDPGIAMKLSIRRRSQAPP